MSSTYKPETIALHGGQKPDPATNARAVPIYQTTSYVFNDTAHAARLFGLQEFGNIYTRIMNPTTDVFEQRVAQLEGGTGALAMASGQAAETLALLNIARAGDEILSSASLYGGTYNLFHYTFPKMGIEVKFVDPKDPESFRKALTKKTKAIFAESVGNPKLDTLDFAAVSKVAHDAGIPLVVDNTMPTPFLMRPFDHGADIVIHSATKFIGGHGTSIGGIVVDSGKFDWGNGNFPEFTAPDPSYHGLKYLGGLREFPGPRERRLHHQASRPAAARPRARRCRPSTPSSSCRGWRRFTCGWSGTARTPWPWRASSRSTPTSPGSTTRGCRATPRTPWRRSTTTAGCTARSSGSASREAIAAGKKFIESLKLFSHLANIGDAKSLVIHPASTTHQQLTPAEQLATGVTDDFVRLSVGIENIDDITGDLDQALRKS